MVALCKMVNHYFPRVSSKKLIERKQHGKQHPRNVCPSQKNRSDVWWVFSQIIMKNIRSYKYLNMKYPMTFRTVSMHVNNGPIARHWKKCAIKEGKWFLKWTRSDFNMYLYLFVIVAVAVGHSVLLKPCPIVFVLLQMVLKMRTFQPKISFVSYCFRMINRTIGVSRSML